MEIDLNRLRNELERVQKTTSQNEQILKSKEIAYGGLQEEFTNMQKLLETANSKLSESTTKYLALDSQLQNAQKELETANSEITKNNATIASLEKDYHTLKTALRETETKLQEVSRTFTAKTREVQDLEDALAEANKRANCLESEKDSFRIKLERTLVENRKLTGSSPTADDEINELEDAERNRLRGRIQVLEEQLEAERKNHQHLPSQRHPVQTRHTRGMSIISNGSFLSDDMDFGKEMMAARQKEEDAAEERRIVEGERLERVREVKRGLEKWKGWRMDLTLAGGSAHGLGEMFEV